MAKQEAIRTLSEDQRKEVFLALVQVQDEAVNVLQSRKMIAGRFGLGERQVRQIEQEGLDACWPPLE